MRIKEEDFGICAAEASTKEEDFGKVPSQHSVCHKALLQYKCDLFCEAHFRLCHNDERTRQDECENSGSVHPFALGSWGYDKSQPHSSCGLELSGLPGQLGIPHQFLTESFGAEPSGNSDAPDPN